ncbi:MAG: MBL fold metallo-hydrolase [Candidatus Staskawiczbacteria bacterium]|jgi:competence protein ComEC
MEITKNKIIIGAIGLLVLLNGFAWQIVFNLSSQQYLKVDFLSVGQGDATFVETPSKQQILIDGGPDSTILEKLGQEMLPQDRTIDLIILTHPEADHMTGLLEVLKRYEVRNVLWTGVIRDTAEWREWNSLIEEEGAGIWIAQAGGELVLQKESPRIVINILNPPENLRGKKLEDSNNTSIVLSLIIGDRTFLLTGDINSSGEQLLGERIGADVLKIAHHGSKYSTSEEFLNIVSPSVAVISVGKNTYGHPAEELLARLDKFGIETLRTDLSGDIKFISDGKNIKIINN